jgi:hypothetical protein
MTAKPDKATSRPILTHLYPIHSAAYWFARSLAKNIIIHHVVGGPQRTPTRRRPEISAPSGAVCAAASPDNDGDRPRERGDHKAEVDPHSISLGGPGKHEHMDHDPQAHREPHSKPNEIARGLVYMGLLARTVTATSAPINSARSTIAKIRSPIGMLGAAVPPLDGLGCSGVALKNSIWRYSHLPCRWCDSRRKNSR